MVITHGSISNYVLLQSLALMNPLQVLLIPSQGLLCALVESLAGGVPGGVPGEVILLDIAHTILHEVEPHQKELYTLYEKVEQYHGVDLHGASHVHG